MAMESSRFTDLSDEPVDHLLAPIKGYQDEPLISLPAAIQPVSEFFHEIKDYVFVALHNCENPLDGLTQAEAASIYLYTMQFHGGPSLYTSLNQSLRGENRDELKPWFSYLKLFLTALYKLPSESQIVWRGVKNVNLTSKYKKGAKFAWWGVSSCTTDLEVLESNHFLGKNGLRTLFSIECINGKSIANYSYFKNKEKEVILVPGSYFEVMGQLNPAPELYIIHLKEILPPITLVKPPFPLSASISSPSSDVNKSNPISLTTLNIIRQHIFLDVMSKEISLKSNIRWKQVGITVAGGNDKGNQFNQLFYPHGIFIDDDQTLCIADWGNHRIVEWESNVHNGRIVAGGNGRGNQINQLNGPTAVILDQENHSLIIADRLNRRVIQWSRQNPTEQGEILLSDINCWSLIMDKNGSLYVSDCEENEVRRWKRGETKGKIVAGGNGKGDHANQLHFPTYIFVDEDESLYVSDTNNHRVMKWMKDAEEGIVVAGGNGQGKTLSQLSSPYGVIVHPFGQICVADCYNNRVMCWYEEAREGTIVVGGNGSGERLNQLNCPNGLSFDSQGSLYVVDYGNNRIQKFAIDENESYLF